MAVMDQGHKTSVDLHKKWRVRWRKNPRWEVARGKGRWRVGGAQGKAKTRNSVPKQALFRSESGPLRSTGLSVTIMSYPGLAVGIGRIDRSILALTLRLRTHEMDRLPWRRKRGLHLVRSTEYGVAEAKLPAHTPEFPHAHGES